MSSSPATRPDGIAGRIPTLWRWAVPVLALALLAGSLIRALPAHSDSSTRPNIVFILTDDQRFDTLWAMPTVQQDLVSRGITLSNYFLADPLCCPSRSSIMRGQYPHGTGVYNNDTGPFGGYGRFHEMGDDESNIATWLHDAGYRTGLVGKYLNGYNGPMASIVPPGWDTWNALVDTSYYNFAESENGVFTRFYSGQYQTDVLGQQALNFIDSTPDDQSMFLYWAPHAPHADATPAPQDVGTFSWLPQYRPPSFNEPDVSDKPEGMRKPLLDVDQVAHVDTFRERQYEALQDVDRWVGKIVDELEATGRLENTLIVFSTDNGLMYGEHRIPTVKNVPYEEAIRSPFVARWDGVIPPGTIDGHFGMNIDLAPTFAEIAGATPTNQVDGVSLMPVLTGTVSDDSWRHDFLIEHGGGATVAPPFCALRSDSGYLYVNYFTTMSEELYDLGTDPYEDQNVAGDPAYSSVIHGFRSRLRELCSPEPLLLPDEFRPPGSPVDVSATAEDGGALVAWSPPTGDGGSPVTGYTVTASPDGTSVQVDGSATQADVQGLTNGTDYTFTVTATSAYGDGTGSAPTPTIVPGPPTVPNAPTNVIATGGEASATVTWTAPVSDPRVPVTSYTVTSSPDDVTGVVDGSTTAAVVPGLTDGVSYTFTVTATNAVGNSDTSAPSNAVTAGQATAPMAPSDVQATPGDGSAAVTWDPPASDGGSALTGYTVTSDPGGMSVTVEPSTTQAIVSGLDNGSPYTFSVTATNAVGTGPASAPSNAVTPAPPAPQVEGFSPGGGPVGTTVAVIGSHLEQTQSVMFGSVSAAFDVLSDNQLSVVVPDGAPSVPITVVTPDGTATSADRYEVAPVIGSFSPTQGKAKTVVTVNGSAFIDVTSVKLGTVPVQFTVASYWTITFRVPRGSRTGKIFIVTRWGHANTTMSFKVGGKRKYGGRRDYR
jgi:N-acetylglucosamine-6-sulfatase